MNLAGREGNVGILIEIKESAEIETAVKGLKWGFNELIALVAVDDLTRELLSKLVSSTSISGILLVRDRTRPFDGFSEDGISPNKEYSIYGEETLNWNELSASGFLKQTSKSLCV
uniref:Ncstrn_small domain-containing protein n=1 Tax=Bursaphelenchus xylophilus TaxID=6326 RepID=A0A1I7SNF1_BURXY